AGRSKSIDPVVKLTHHVQIPCRVARERTCQRVAGEDSQVNPARRKSFNRTSRRSTHTDCPSQRRTLMRPAGSIPCWQKRPDQSPSVRTFQSYCCQSSPRKHCPHHRRPGLLESSSYRRTNHHRFPSTNHTVECRYRVKPGPYPPGPLAETAE